METLRPREGMCPSGHTPQGVGWGQGREESASSLHLPTSAVHTSRGAAAQVTPGTLAGLVLKLPSDQISPWLGLLLFFSPSGPNGLLKNLRFRKGEVR